MEQILVTEEKKISKLKLGLYPYTYARISVMKAKLIKKDTYNKLLKMKVGEIAKFLQDTEYRKEIDELASSRSGVELIENALNINMLRTFIKLKRISEDENLRELIEVYMIRKDIANIKTILRGKHSNQSEEEIRNLILPIGRLHESVIMDLLSKESINEIVSSLNFIEFSRLKEAAASYKEKKNLFELENALDKDYYSFMLEFSRRMPKQGEFFRKFIENEIDILNIKLLMRLKKEKVDKKEIERYLFYPGAKLSRNELSRMAGIEDIRSMLKFLQRAGHSKLAKELEKTKDSLVKTELKLNKYLLDMTVLLLHQNPLSVDVILGYMFAKEIEIKNLKTIVKGKQLGLEEGFIENELIMGSK